MKKTKLVVTLAFVLLIGGLTIFSAIAKDKDFSENENRYLSSFPELTWDNFISGEFQDGLEEYLRDHIVFRDQWTGGRTAVTQLLGGCDVGGAYIGKDGYLFEKTIETDVDDKLFDRNVEAIQKYFAAMTGIVDEECMSIMLVPTSARILDTKTPNYAILYDQDKYLDAAAEAFGKYNYIETRTVLESQADEELYYRTDHHWTTLGAYYAYRSWCQRTNHICLDQSKFEVTEVTDSFKGSLYSKVLNLNSAKDSIWRYDRLTAEEYTVTEDGNEKDSFYEEEMLNKKDKYAYFFGGNYAQVSIEKHALVDGNAAERNLLVLKDSFANSFIPFIAAEYDNVYMVDLRYYSGDMVTYATEHEITDILVLYNITNFVSDRNIRKLGLGLSTVVPEPEPEPEPTPTPEPEPAPQPGEEAEEKEPGVIYTQYEPTTSGNLIIFGDTGFELYSYKEEMGEKYAQGISDLADILEGKAKVYDLLVPLSSGITMPDAYQSIYDVSSQEYALNHVESKVDDNVAFVNIYKTLMAHRTEYLYFRTDHHWTGLGAYYAYTAFCQAAGVEAVPLEEYETVTYSGFLGSLYKDSKSSGMKNNPDTIIAYKPISDSKMTFTDDCGNVITGDILVNGDLLPVSEKYCVFIHGDNPISDVVNTELNDGSACIVVKESYGNAFVPFLIEHYQHVYVIDYRYWTGNLADLVDETGAQDVIFVNNIYSIRNQYLMGKLLGMIYE